MVRTPNCKQDSESGGESRTPRVNRIQAPGALARVQLFLTFMLLIKCSRAHTAGAGPLQTGPLSLSRLGPTEELPSSSALTAPEFSRRVDLGAWCLLVPQPGVRDHCAL